MWKWEFYEVLGGEWEIWECLAYLGRLFITIIDNLDGLLAYLPNNNHQIHSPTSIKINKPKEQYIFLKFQQLSLTKFRISLFSIELKYIFIIFINT